MNDTPEGPEPSRGRAVNLRFTYARDDVARAIRANFGAQAGVRFNTFVAVCLMLLGLWLIASGAGGGLALASLIAGAAFIALLAGMWFFGPDIALWRDPKYRDAYDLTYSDAGVTFRKGGAENTLPWTIYTHALIEAEGYRLHHGRESWIVLPARAFAGPDDRTLFESLLEAHVPLIERR